MTVSITNTIKAIVDSESAEIEITTLEGQVTRLSCIYKESNAPSFFLVFPPKKLPENIDTEKACPVAIKIENSPFALTADIIDINSDRSLELVAKKTVNPESLREFFRVDTKVSMQASFDPASSDGRVRAWKLKGQTLDVSGSGMLTILPEDPKTKHKIELTLSLNGGKDSISCLGHIIRTKRLRRGRYQVAFHFDTLLPKHRDTIISFCLQEQRNKLRDKVETIG